ncbi:hypothetical protein OJ998_10175 [Solirubrobacter taibaiensis]|nr:hypothetical protein [Solirubrobacter taibaiensis]
MINRTLIAALAILVLAPTASASAKTETLRFYSKVDKATLIKADGTEVPPGPDPAAAGDRLEILASDFAGTFKKHAKKATASEHVVCTFTTAPEPDCIAHVAIGGSMLIFKGFPGTLIGGSGKYLGATGKVISNKTIPGTNDSEVVARIKLAE